MSLGTSKGMVADAAKQLVDAWKLARRDWDDDTARWFEAEFLEPVAPRVRSVIAAMDKLGAMTARAERECA